MIFSSIGLSIMERWQHWPDLRPRLQERDIRIIDIHALIEVSFITFPIGQPLNAIFIFVTSWIGRVVVMWPLMSQAIFSRTFVICLWWHVLEFRYLSKTDGGVLSCISYVAVKLCLNDLVWSKTKVSVLLCFFSGKCLLLCLWDVYL